MFGVAGVTWIAVSAAAVTVSTRLPETKPPAAVMVVVPTLAAAAMPVELPIEATAVVDELHVTCVVRFWVELSENTPVATSCKVRPLARLGAGGVISMPTSIGAVTVKVVEALFPERLAESVTLPATKALSIPCELTVAMAVLLEVQVTCDEMLDLLPSE